VSLRARLVATLLLLVVLGLAVADVGTYVALRSFLLNRVDRQVKTVTDLVEAYAASHEATRTHFFDPGTPTMFGQDSGDTTVFRVLAAGGVAPPFLQLRYPDNRVMKTLTWETTAPRLPAVLPVSTSPGAGPDGAVAFTAPSAQRRRDRRGGSEWRVRAVRLPGSGGYLLAMATPTKDVQETLGHLRQIEAAVGVLVLLGVALLARRSVRRGLRPLEEIGETARAIGAGELDRRVEPADARTEVGRLGLALNAMLHQLDTAFQRRRASEERLRRFVADASHELRTPLTSIRGYAELFRRGAGANPDDLAKAMRRIEAEAARMGALVDELLLLTRLDQGRPLERGPVDLAALAADAVADARAVEPERPSPWSAAGRWWCGATRTGCGRCSPTWSPTCCSTRRRPPRCGCGPASPTGGGPRCWRSPTLVPAWPASSANGSSSASGALTGPGRARVRAASAMAAPVSACRSWPPSSPPTAAGRPSSPSRDRAPPSASSCRWTGRPTGSQKPPRFRTGSWKVRLVK